MLKQQAATAVLHRSRIIFVTSASNAGQLYHHPPPPSIMSTTDGSVRVHQAPNLPSDHAPEQIKQQQPPSRGPATYFPLGYKEAAYQWWSSVTPSMAERNVLSFMPILKEAADSLANPNATETTYPLGTRIWKRSMVQLSGKNRALNEVSVERAGEEHEETLVMLHGYGAGLGFFYKNFEPLSRVSGYKLYALDMLGMGNSSRPPFKINAKTREEQVIEAENWFVDALEEWRKERKIQRFTLLGHSLGGYLAVSYALKYPGHLNKLILASPVGIPKDPFATTAAMPEPGSRRWSRSSPKTSRPSPSHPEALLSMRSKPPHPQLSQNVHCQGGLSGSGTKTSPLQHHPHDRPPRPSLRVRMDLPPIQPPRAHRGSGPPRLLLLHLQAKGSGEYALGYILAPGAYARRPIIDRVQHLGRQPISQPEAGQPTKETGYPVVFMYGENDWMDVAGGLAAEEKLKQARLDILLNGTDEEKRAENGSAKVVIVPKAGHHLYLDNADNFNDVIRKELEETKASERKRRAQLSDS
uniref:AB hydrolase-1 domain-containing protein n=1 Tax=Bionectria ochroleuca TaxID=29856 RepID=A0A8H7NPH4_BIOOC